LNRRNAAISSLTGRLPVTPVSISESLSEMLDKVKHLATIHQPNIKPP